MTIWSVWWYDRYDDMMKWWSGDMMKWWLVWLWWNDRYDDMIIWMIWIDMIDHLFYWLLIIGLLLDRLMIDGLLLVFDLVCCHGGSERFSKVLWLVAASMSHLDTFISCTSIDTQYHQLFVQYISNVWTCKTISVHILYIKHTHTDITTNYNTDRWWNISGIKGNILNIF